MYYIYMLRCEDNSIYTGIAKDLNKRMKEHFTKDKKCAKYTHNHNAKYLEIVWKTENRVLASKLEYHIKKLSKIKKEEIIKKNNLEAYLDTKLEIGKYTKVDIEKTTFV